ncbi:MAG: hypothetical protein ABSD49_08290 [Candidatus Bathyarchaeia archaeon]
MDLIHEVSALFSFVNVLLLLGLIWVYGNGFRKIRAQFTAGLLFFAGLFLVQNLLALYSFLAMFMYYATDVGGFVLAYTIVQTAGLVVLLWLSLR